MAEEECWRAAHNSLIKCGICSQHCPASALFCVTARTSQRTRVGSSVPDKEHAPRCISVMVAELLLAAVKATEATVAFDATGGGNLEVSVKAFCGGVVEGFGRCDTGLRCDTAEGHSYSPFRVSFSTGAYTTVDSKGSEVVTMVRRLAQKEHPAALSQLASRISVVVKFGAGAGEEPVANMKKLITDVKNKLQSEVSSEADAGDDPFAKVKELVTDLITDLTDRLQSETSHKIYCDDELTKASVKKEELENHAAHSLKLETAVSKNIATDGEVAELHADLGDLSRQLKMNAMRVDELEGWGQHHDDGRVSSCGRC